MKLRLPLFTRREFIKKTSSAGAVASVASAVVAPTIMRASSVPAGAKGKSYPDERRKYTDSKSGHTVWQLTNTPAGRNSSYSYYNVPKTTPDGRWALYSTDRWNAQAGSVDLFKMDLRTGESIQLTESGDVEHKDIPVLTADGREVYFFDKGKNLRVVDMETFTERKVMTLPKNAEGPLHNASVSHDKRFMITSRPLEPRALYTYLSDIALHHALFSIRTDNGESQIAVQGMYPIGIIEFCPTNSDLILWDVHGGWEEVHRPWVIKRDGTGNYPVMPTIKGEGSGHQFWGWSGQTIFSVISGGGRYPQGLWVCDKDGASNQRCVQSGMTHAHSAANPEEDRFVSDEIYGRTDALVMSKKGSLESEILCQIIPWFELRKGQQVQVEATGRPIDKVIGTTPFHTHHRFLPSGNAVAFSAQNTNGGGDIWLVEL